jgi:SRSO17 transposase
MLPDIRQLDYKYAVPKFDLGRDDIPDLITELKGFHENFTDCFQRSESRDNFYRYMSGQLCHLERKSIEPIAFAIEGAKVRAMQRFVSDAPWNEDKIMSKYHSLLNDDIGHPDGAIIFDESGFAKKGDDSIGVARQYSGNIGKVDNCQVGVFAAYTSPHGYSLIDKRLYVPEYWFSDEYSERREKCLLPPEIKFQTKPQLAAEILRGIAEQKQLPFRYVLADSVYANPDFVEAAESIVGVTYLLQIAEDTRCWLQNPVTVEKEYKYRGQKRSKKVLSIKANSSITA